MSEAEEITRRRYSQEEVGDIIEDEIGPVS